MHRLFVCAAALALTSAPTYAQTRTLTPPAAVEKARPGGLESLFERLAAAKDETEANGVASLIERRWARSGSDTADLLMHRAGEALKAKELPLAIELLDRVIALQPGWAEAWHRRATAFFMLDDPASAMADLRQVLAREPRHFGAWAGLGHILMSGGDKASALEAYRRALALHPHMPRLKQAVDRLAPEVDGRDI
ncbi:MAG TPA: tetratricopeptide repeat protein [Beijerinckiaceae bacterium]|nr:tetratricopeptide repeat protein [Beijerinckiaceae bacterium]